MSLSQLPKLGHEVKDIPSLYHITSQFEISNTPCEHKFVYLCIDLTMVRERVTLSANITVTSIESYIDSEIIQKFQLIFNATQEAGS